MLSPIRISGQGTVRDRQTVIAGQQLVIVILWLLVLVGPAVIMKANLSSGATTMLDAYDATVAATAIAVTADYCQKRRNG